MTDYYEGIVLRAVDYIEKHLREEIHLDDIAAAAYCAPYHFHRIFKRIVGNTPGNYIRERRLTEAARELKESDRRILEIAIDYGFESQISFTSSFKNCHRLPPGLFRKKGVHGFSREPLTRQNLLNLRRKTMLLPKIVERDELKLVGCVSYGGDIGELWDVFMRIEDSIQHAKPGVGYELHVFPENTSKYHIMAGIEVEKFDDQPIESFTKIIPGGLFAVFTHKLANGGYAGANDDMDKWLMESEYRQAYPASIQVFDERFKDGNQPDSEIDFLIPIVKR
ncbi:MAG: AraC family transcriptional regulator [Spirochaetales bacterium]|nr:AraC family transcriptional regulator [Spirochaetales bacterium]